LSTGSILHRLPAGPKLAALAVAGTIAFLVEDWRWLAAALLAVLALHALARIPARKTLGPLRAAALVLGLVFLAQGLSGAWIAGLAATLRLAALILLASFVTLTTRQSDMTDALARGLRPLKALGLDTAALALGLSLALRFIPLIAAEATLVREAQRARGLERNPLALFVPLIVRVLKMADDLGEAIDARGGGLG
jgi:biotin transport system permease protein